MENQKNFRKLLETHLTMVCKTEEPSVQQYQEIENTDDPEEYDGNNSNEIDTMDEEPEEETDLYEPQQQPIEPKRREITCVH